MSGIVTKIYIYQMSLRRYTESQRTKQFVFPMMNLYVFQTHMFYFYFTLEEQSSLQGVRTACFYEPICCYSLKNTVYGTTQSFINFMIKPYGQSAFSVKVNKLHQLGT